MEPDSASIDGTTRPTKDDKGGTIVSNMPTNDDEVNMASPPQPANTTNDSGRRTRRAAPTQLQPGAYAVEGPDPGMPMRARRLENQKSTARPENQASIVRADAVDDAELVVYASSVSPDERVKMRRRMIVEQGLLLCSLSLAYRLA